MNEIKNHVPFSEYLDLPYISAHGLMLIERSPAHYRAAMQAPHRPSPKQELGTLTHLAILEPDEYTRRRVIAPDCDKRTKAGKAEWEAYQAALPADASPRGFSRAAANFCYHLQAALYTDLLFAVTGQNYDLIFLVVENESPHGVALYQLEDDAIEAGRRRYQAALETYR